jgi:undecaprenyl pyrophosphate phosphatase UppP
MPISSSCHLIVVPWALGGEPQSFSSDVPLHLDSLVAVLANRRAGVALTGDIGLRGALAAAPSMASFIGYLVRAFLVVGV